MDGNKSCFEKPAVLLGLSPPVGPRDGHFIPDWSVGKTLNVLPRDTCVTLRDPVFPEVTLY